jgi:hypothetical protein
VLCWQHQQNPKTLKTIPSSYLDFDLEKHDSNSCVYWVFTIVYCVFYNNLLGFFFNSANCPTLCCETDFMLK